MKSNSLISLTKKLLLSSLMLTPAFTYADNYNAYDIEIVLDSSGSMAEAVGGKSKMDSAKEAIKTLVEKIPAETRVGFRAYGHQSSRDAKNCKDSELLVPIKSIQKEEFNAKVDSLKPNGYTPIEYSLLEAKKDFEANPEFKKMIILVSDGKETCGGDPCKAVKVLKDIGFDLEVNAVGFSVDAETEKELKCIADATGGIYKNASNAQELVESLESYTKRAKMEYKAVENTIKPGSGFADATLITPGEFNMDIQDKESHFYKFEVKKGQKLSVVANGRNKTPKRFLACFNRLKIDLFNSIKVETGSKAESFDSDKVGLTSVAMQDLDISKTQTLYLVVSDSAYDGAGSKGCDKHKILYELGLYLEGGEEAPTAPKESGPVE